jgi:hypothetical protein
MKYYNDPETVSNLLSRGSMWSLGLQIPEPDQPPAAAANVNPFGTSNCEDRYCIFLEKDLNGGNKLWQPSVKAFLHNTRREYSYLFDGKTWLAYKGSRQIKMGPKTDRGMTLVGKLFKATDKQRDRLFGFLGTPTMLLVTGIEDSKFDPEIWRRKITCLVNEKIVNISYSDFELYMRTGELEEIK